MFVDRSNGWNYLTFRFWIGIWMAFALFIMVMFDLSALVRHQLLTFHRQCILIYLYISIELDLPSCCIHVFFDDAV